MVKARTSKRSTGKKSPSKGASNKREMVVARPRAAAYLISVFFSIIGGALATAGFPPLAWWWGPPIGVSGLLIAVWLLRSAPFAVLWHMFLALVWGAAFWGPMLSWTIDATDSWIPLFALAFIMCLFTCLFVLLWRWGFSGFRFRKRQASPIVVAMWAVIAWLAVEELRSIFPWSGFPWGKLAFTQVQSPLRGFVPLGGSIGATGAVMFCAGLIFVLAVSKPKVFPTTGIFLLGAAVFLASALVPIKTTAEDGTAHIGAVQGNVSRPGLYAYENYLEVTTNHARGTIELANSVTSPLDMVILPENATDVDPRSDAKAADIVEDAATQVKAPVLLGAVRYFDDKDGIRKRYNEMLLWRSGMGPTEVYAKQHPVPYGEYLPLRGIVNKIMPLASTISVDMVAGTQPAILNVPLATQNRTVPIAVPICFEVADDKVVRESVVAGGQFIAVPTNNAHFKFSQEAAQQLQMTQFRALEHSRASVQASTVGLSAFVNPDGSLATEVLDLFTAGSLEFRAPLRTTLTPAAVYGEAMGYVVLGLCFGGLGFLGLRAMTTRKGRNV
ncbi:MAG: apolipoprotein N-acyltransferase [Actinomycetaceae bacterium]|nr:apolipoprotein N-acyltransferase [Actinomycetaceae bacterium]